MKEWVKKEEGVSFGETSEQQPTATIMADATHA
jgi:hypothetical protein